MHDRLVEYHLRFHLRQVGQIEELLSLPYGHAFLDRSSSAAPSVLDVVKNAVMRRADGAAVDLLLEQRVIGRAGVAGEGSGY